MKTQKHYRTCNLCEAMCGLEITHREKEIISIKGDKDDPFSLGHICPKALALKDIYEDKDRLKKPVKKTADGWQEITWNEAYEIVAGKIVEIQTKSGSSSVGIYNGNPVVHNSGTMLSAPSFFRALKTKNKYSATSVDQLPHQFMAYLMFGHQLKIPVPDIDRTDFLLIIGANPLISNGSLLSAPDMKGRLRAIQHRRGKIVNVDPRFTETSAKSDQHIYIKPGTDAFFLLGLAHVIFDEGLIQHNRLTDHIKALDEFEKISKGFSPEKVEGITGIGPDVIRQVAREFTSHKKSVIYGRMGACTQEFGGLAMWLVNALNIVTGNFDEPGGAMFASPAVDIKPITTKGHIGRWSSRVRKAPEFANELPVATLAEDILETGEGQIRAMIINAGNPILSTPNGTQLKTAFESLDFLVSIDIYINETSSLADIILPPATGLEVDHYDIVFHSLAVRNTAKYSQALFKLEKGAKYDWQIFKGLKKAYLKKKGNYGIKKRLYSLIDDFITPERMLSQALKKGNWSDIINLSKLKKNPHGIDLGSLTSQLPEGLYTEDKKINLVPNELKIDLNRLEEKLSLKQKQDTKLQLIGRRQLRTCNSWLHNSERMLKSNSCTAMIHPKDAIKAGLNGSNIVRIKSRVGTIDIPYELTENIVEGTLSVPHGWGHLGDIHLAVASSNPGASINDLTDDQFMDQLTGNAALNGVEVEIERIP